MAAYYNEIDNKTAEWMRELIAAGLIPDGEVDERSIKDVRPEDLKGFTQCHFFGGISGWAYALRLAGWPDERPVWTGSCPCQPFSVAGKGAGTDDERHLWPAFRWLIAQCRPATVFGEQVASADGREWLSGVRADLEAMEYRVGGADLCAAGVGAPHIRQRLWWVADCADEGSQGRMRCGEERQENGHTGRSSRERVDWSQSVWWPCRDGKWRRVPARRLGYPTGDGRRECEPQRGKATRAAACGAGEGGGVGDGTGRGRRERGNAAQQGSCGHPDGAKQNGGSGVSHAEGGQRGGVRNTGEAQGPCRGVELPGVEYGVQLRNEGHDGLEIEPALFSLLSDGISAIMGIGWTESYVKTKKEVELYAKETNARPREVLRQMWCQNAQEAIQRNHRGHGSFSSTDVLLIALCQLKRDQKPENRSTTQDFIKTAWATLRIVWAGAGELASLACPPHQRELDGPPSRESGDVVRWVPPKTTPCTNKTGTVQSVWGKIKTEPDVSKALSAVAEIWRSAFDEEGGRKRLQSCQSWTYGLTRFPLAPGLPGRVGLLRGAGNAIVPAVAAKFIQAAVESGVGQGVILNPTRFA